MLAALVSGFADMRDADKQKAIEGLTEKGYCNICDVTPDTIEGLDITEGAKRAMKRQLPAVQAVTRATTVPTSGEKQVIGADELLAINAYVSEGIKTKEFSWGVEVPESKPLIDADGPSYTWTAPDTSKWSASQVVELVSETKLQFGLLSGVSDPSTTLVRASYPALCLKGAGGWRDVILRPDPTFEKSVVAFRGSTYKKTFEHTAKSMSVSGRCGLFSANVKRTLDRQQGSIKKDEEFSIVTRVSCYGCELNLADHLAIRPEVEKEFAEVCDDPRTNRIEKLAKINALFEKYGTFYVRRCKLGVQATGTNTLTSKFTFNASKLAETLEAGCSFGFLLGSCAAKRGFSGSSELEKTAMAVSEHLNIKVNGATVAPNSQSLTSIALSAGDPRQWAALDISDVVPIVDLFEDKLRAKVEALSVPPWSCRVVEVKSARCENPTATVSAADIKKRVREEGYIVIGGGAWVDNSWLMKSRPTYDTEMRTTGWTASARGVTAVVTAYAICLKPNDASIELDAKVAIAMDSAGRSFGSIQLTQDQAQGQHPGYTLVSGGGRCKCPSSYWYLTASSPTGNGATVEGWEVESNERNYDVARRGETFVYGVMLKNIAGFQYRVKRHRSVCGDPTNRCVEDHPELSTTQVVCGGGAKVNPPVDSQQMLSKSAPITNGITGAPTGWANSWCNGLKTGVTFEAYTVYFDIVPSHETD